MRVVVSDTQWPLYTQVGRPLLSPDGQHVAYVAVRGGLSRLVVNDAETEPFDALSESVRFSADGTQVVFGARQDRECWRLVRPVPLPHKQAAPGGSGR